MSATVTSMFITILTVLQTEIRKQNEIAFRSDPSYNLQFSSCNAEMFMV